LIDGRLEDALETGVLAGRGMMVQRAFEPKTRETCMGIGIDFVAEFRRLPDDQRRIGDGFALITAVLPAALWMVKISLSDPSAAIAAGGRAAAVCSQLADDEFGDRDLWRITAELFAVSSVDRTNADQIISRIMAVDGKDEKALALRILAHLLATWHATPTEAIRFQFGCIETLQHWYRDNHSIYHLILVPYIQSFWQHVINECPFAFRAPAVTSAAINAAAEVPETERIHAVLSAVASSFPVRGAQEILANLRKASCDAP
jgi:hypothetical protein